MEDRNLLSAKLFAIHALPVQATEGAPFSGAVASFSAPPGLGKNSAVTATISWGDGHTSLGTIRPNASGGTDIFGTNTYDEEGSFPLTITVQGRHDQTATATSQANVADAVLVASGTSFSSILGQPFTKVVATFTDPGGAETLAHYGATIAWGDGTPTSSGTITLTGNTFSVWGTHTFTHAVVQPITVSLAHDDLEPLTVTSDDPGLVTSATVVNVDPSGGVLPGSPVTFTAFVTGGGAPDILTSPSGTVAFSDGTTNLGTATLAGIAGPTSSAALTTSSLTQGQHTITAVYSGDGIYAPSSTSVSYLIFPGMTPGVLTAAGTSYSVQEGFSYPLPLATFADSDLLGSAFDYTATIDWGDGHSTPGAVSLNPLGGYSVFGAYIYPEEGTYTLHISIADDDGSSAAVTSTATVTEAPLTLHPLPILTATEGAPDFSYQANFTDPNFEDPADYQATIAWGDGTTASAGTLTLVSLGSYNVAANHVYREAGVFTITVTVTEDAVSHPPGYATSATSVVTVNEAVLTVAPLTLPTNLAKGSPFSGTLATFHDDNPLDAASDYTASITWGDGSTSSGAITGSGGNFTVAGGHTFLAAGTYTVTLAVKDDDMAPVAVSTTVTVADVNHPPVLAPLGPFTVAEGTLLTFTASATDPDVPAQTLTLSLASQLPAGATFNAATGVFSWTPLDGPTDPSPVDVVVRVTDSGSPPLFDTQTVKITVNNVKPTLSLAAPSAIDENGFATLAGTITDPGTLDTFTLTLNWGDPLSPGNVQMAIAFPASATGTQNFTLTHQYLDDNPSGTATDPYTISATVTDKDGGVSTPASTTVVTVNNVPPSNLGMSLTTASLNENGTLSISSGSFQDPGTLDTHTVTINWADPNSPTNTSFTLPAGVLSFTAGTLDINNVPLGARLSHQYLDDGLAPGNDIPGNGTPFDVSAVTMTVTDDDSGTASISQNVTVNNLNPVLSNLTITPSIFIGDTATLTGGVTDVGTLDTHTLQVDWGDGSATGPIYLPLGVASFSVQHQYVLADASGFFTIKVDAVDDDGGAAEQQEKIEVKTPKINLSSVAYLGEGNVIMKKDGPKPTDGWFASKFGSEGALTINYPEWQDHDLDGVPEVDDPAAYVRSSKPEMFAVIVLDKALANPVNVKFRVTGQEGSFDAKVSIAKDVNLSGQKVNVSGLLWNVSLPDTVLNSNAPLKWEISFDGGKTYRVIGETDTRFFVTYGTPQGYLANPGVTAQRLNLVTQVADGLKDQVAIAKEMIASTLKGTSFNREFHLDEQMGNHWQAFDVANSAMDCISLSILVVKELRMLGMLSATEGKAYATGGKPPKNSDTGDLEYGKFGNDTVGLGFFAAGGINLFEGYFEITDGGVRKAFTVDPIQGPILESTDNVQGDKLKYNVIKTTLGLIRTEAAKNDPTNTKIGFQFWFEYLPDKKKFSDTPYPKKKSVEFPGLPQR